MCVITWGRCVMAGGYAGKSAVDCLWGEIGSVLTCD